MRPISTWFSAVSAGDLFKFILITTFCLIFYELAEGFLKGRARAIWRGLGIAGCILVAAGFFFYAVANRQESPTGARYNFQLFWSYRWILEKGSRSLVILDLWNFAALIPAGYLLKRAGGRRMRWWKAGLLALLFSCGIEVVQLVGHYGLCELDDVFHNTLGTVFGYMLACVVEKLKYTGHRRS